MACSWFINSLIFLCNENLKLSCILTIKQKKKKKVKTEIGPSLKLFKTYRITEFFK